MTRVLMILSALLLDSALSHAVFNPSLLGPSSQSWRYTVRLESGTATIVSQKALLVALHTLRRKSGQKMAYFDFFFRGSSSFDLRDQYGHDYLLSIHEIEASYLDVIIHPKLDLAILKYDNELPFPEGFADEYDSVPLRRVRVGLGDELTFTGAGTSNVKVRSRSGRMLNPLGFFLARVSNTVRDRPELLRATSIRSLQSGGVETAQGGCRGDSGAPVLRRFDDGIYYLAGVQVSGNSNLVNSDVLNCGDGVDFIPISEFYDWLTQNI